MRISIVTPCLNAERYLEQAIDSVTSQRFPDLEYVVVDGGSTDGSVDIIRGREGGLSQWLSEEDSGLYDALNKGFALTSGEVMGWLNADDLHTPWTLAAVEEIFESFPQIDWITSAFPLFWDTEGRAVHCSTFPGVTAKGFLRGESLPLSNWYARGWIQQESTFWRRSLWERAGASMDGGLRLAGDFELWARFFQFSKLVSVQTPLAGFRRHGDQLSVRGLDVYLTEALGVIERFNGRTSGPIASAMRRLLDMLTERFVSHHLSGAGPVCRHDGQGWVLEPKATP